MTGELIPIALIPRFMTYLGMGTYVTIPVLVSDFKSLTLEFWRGTLAFSAVGGTFNAYLEESMDPDAPVQQWSVLWSTGTPDAQTRVEVTLTRPYLRVRIVLGNSNYGQGGYSDTYSCSGISCWAEGFMERRVSGEGA